MPLASSDLSPIVPTDQARNINLVRRLPSNVIVQA